MVYWSLFHILTFFLDIFTIIGVNNNDKDLEIIILRQQVRILQRKMKTIPRISDPERMILATLIAKYRETTSGANVQLNQIMLVFKPDTILRWHREMVRRKWTFRRKANPGRSKISSELEALIVHLAKENPRWGYDKIQGELLKLGHRLGPTSVRNILKRHRITPASKRSSGSWGSLLSHCKEQILACDFFTVVTIWLNTIFVLFFIELGNRRIHWTGCTMNPDSAWVTQQARQLVWDLKDRDRDRVFLIHDHDTKFTSSFNSVFCSEGIEIVHTPYQAPRANEFAERWVRSVREKCLDQILVWTENHLHMDLQEYAQYYNDDRPHQGLGLHFPISGSKRKKMGPIRRRDVLGGVIHDYYRQPPTENHAYG